MLERSTKEISQFIHKQVALKQAGKQDLRENLRKQDQLLAKVNRILDEVQEIKKYWESTAAGN